MTSYLGEIAIQYPTVTHLITNYLTPGTNIRVLDPFTIKPLDKEAVLKHAKECGGRVVTVEDHYPEGMIQQQIIVQV